MQYIVYEKTILCWTARCESRINSCGLDELGFHFVSWLSSVYKNVFFLFRCFPVLNKFKVKCMRFLQNIRTDICPCSYEHRPKTSNEWTFNTCMQATYAYVCQLSLRFIELFTLITMPALKSQCIFTFFLLRLTVSLTKPL